jgi:hypothetical protein
LWELLSEKILLQTFVHVGIYPHVNEPPGASQIADGLTEQELLSYLVEKIVGGAQQVSPKRESGAIG